MQPSPPPQVSVILPARNALRWLPRAIASISRPGPGAVTAGIGTAAVKIPALEILVVDDGSTDGTRGYLHSLARLDRRLRPLSAPGLGAAAARNLALAAARAPLVAFLDAPDSWLPGKLARQLELHRLNPDLGFSFTGHRRRTDAGAPLGAEGLEASPRFAAAHAMHREGFVLGPEAQAEIYAAPGLVATSGVMARTALLREVGGFNASLRHAEGWELWLHLSACARVGCLPSPLAELRLATTPRPAAELARRREARRLVAHAYAGPVGVRDRGARRRCRAGLLVAEAQDAAAEGRRLEAALLQLSALARHPSRRLARAAAWDMLGLARPGAAEPPVPPPPGEGPRERRRPAAQQAP